MQDFLIANQGGLRLAVFAGLLAVLGLWESLAPRRWPIVSRAFRWVNNLSLVVVDAAMLRLVFPVLAVEFALIAESHGWGLLNAIAAPVWLKIALAAIALDLVIYVQHRVFHAVPLLWRLHMVHHADPDIDVTTGARFHPFEIALSMAIKLAAIAVLGAPALSVLIFETLLNATSMFNHGNVRMPAGLDRALRLVVVTPDMHRVHHSLIPRETNSNFGFNLPWWDRLFGSYRDQPRGGHTGMTIGLSHTQGFRRQNLWWMLALPFTGAPGGYPRNRADEPPVGAGLKTRPRGPA
ncbi:MAG: sterol desaturase family protein [Pseudomonadota bacterium]